MEKKKILTELNCTNKNIRDSVWSTQKKKKK